MNKNYYEILGVDKNADHETIKKAYRALSMEYHPDRGGDEEKFKEVNGAYSVLSNPSKRAEYDNPMSQMGGFSFHDIFAGQGGSRSPFGAPDPNAPRRGRNIMLEHAAPLHYFILGGKLKVNFSFRDPCPECGGSGAEEKITCTNCKGAGQVIESSQGQGVFMQSSRACPVCHGRGFTAAKQCEPCVGSGSKTIKKDLILEVPAGITEGYIIGTMGEGGTGINGGPAGDLGVKLHMKMPNPDDLTDEQKKVLAEL